MTYTFAPEQAAALADVEVGVTAYLAVKGECWYSGMGPDVTHPGPCRIVPPADLAALVEQRCETCVKESTPGYLDNSDGRARFDCPDCHDGKPLHAIKHECGHCEGSGIEPGYACAACFVCDDGPVSIPGLWTYDALLPVVAVQSWDGTTPAVVIDADQVYVVDGTWSNGEPNATDITVYGTPEPNHFVLAVTRRTP